MPKSEGERAVLILAPSGRDGRLTRELLEAEAISAAVCDDLATLCAAMAAGAAAAVIAEEALTARAVREIAEVLASQPAWSDFPIVVISGAGRGGANRAESMLRALGNVTYLDRPVQVRTMIAAVQSAVRARLRQYEARNAIEARDRFLAMLGHELRNPLAAIRLAIQLADRRGAEGPCSGQHAVIDRQSRHLGKLVDDLLDIARVTHGKLAIQPVDVDLTEVVQSCVQAQQSSTHALTLEADEGPLVVRGERLRLEQVFNNLLTNAMKYTPRGGAVTVRVRREGRTATIEVADTGVGIPGELLPRVFELFAQGEQSLARSQGGMGVGLTVVRSLVHLHGGEVDARSEGAGRGSAFRVRLPLSDPGAAAAMQPAAAPRRARRVVLIEDNDDVRLMLSELLAVAGHAVATAADGPSGVRQILAAHPEVAFVDIGLPGFDGYEVARRIREEAVAVRLVALSGYGQADDRRIALAAGFDLHLTKPVGIAELELALGE